MENKTHSPSRIILHAQELEKKSHFSHVKISVSIVFHTWFPIPFFSTLFSYKSYAHEFSRWRWKRAKGKRAWRFCIWTGRVRRQLSPREPDSFGTGQIVDHVVVGWGLALGPERGSVHLAVWKKRWSILRQNSFAIMGTRKKRERGRTSTAGSS